VIADDDGVVVNPARFFSIFKFKHPSRADRCAYPTTHTGSSDDVLPPLRIPAHIYAHFAVGGTIAAGYALPSIGGDPKPRFEPLDNTDVSSQGTAKPAPNPIAHKRVKSHANHSGKCSPNQKAIPF